MKLPISVIATAFVLAGTATDVRVAQGQTTSGLLRSQSAAIHMDFYRTSPPGPREPAWMLENRVPQVTFSEQQQERILPLALWGTAGSAAGFLGGLLIASASSCNSGCIGEDPGMEQDLLGAMIGSAVITPLAVHIVNDRQGQLLLSYGVAALLAGVGYVGVVNVGNPTDALFLVGIPIAQVVSAVLFARSGGT